MQGASVTFSLGDRRDRRERQLPRRRRPGNRDHQGQRAGDLASVRGQRDPRPLQRHRLDRRQRHRRDLHPGQPCRRDHDHRAPEQARTATVETRYRPLTARVVDANGRPIEGASVTFTLPSAATGAGASFLGGESQATRTHRRKRPGDLAGARGEQDRGPLHGHRIGHRRRQGRQLRAAQPRRRTGRAQRRRCQRPVRRPWAPGSRSGSRSASRDINDNPVAGALVTFTAPARGPSGRFAGGGRTARVRTNDKGVAIAPAFTANATPGGYIVTAGRRRAARPRSRSSTDEPEEHERRRRVAPAAAALRPGPGRERRVAHAAHAGGPVGARDRDRGGRDRRRARASPPPRRRGCWRRSTGSAPTS